MTYSDVERVDNLGPALALTTDHPWVLQQVQ